MVQSTLSRLLVGFRNFECTSITALSFHFKPGDAHDNFVMSSGQRSLLSSEQSEDSQ